MLKQARSATMAFAFLSLPLLARAGVMPAGTEFQVNTYTPFDQFEPDVCKAADGSFVVVWESDGGNDGSGSGVFARRYASSGARLGTEFQVNTYTTQNQFDPDVCCDPAGNFVVVWESYGQDGSSLGIFGQRFTSGGAFVGAQFQVNTHTVGQQDSPNICCDAAGNFVVTWASAYQDGNYSGVFGQRFASNGALAGTEFQVNTYTTSVQAYPAVCCDAAGDFVVAWQSYHQDGDQQGIFGQRFVSSGVPRGTEFQINAYTTSAQANPALCCDEEGDFTVVWESLEQDGYSEGVFGRRFASDGAARGVEFQVNTYTTYDQRDPSICCGLNGGFVVSWESRGQDGYGFGVFARQFGEGGGASSEFQVNTYTTDDQVNSAVACDAKGNFVVVWQANREDSTDDDVFGQRFEVLGLVPTPALSLAGLGLSLIAMLGAGAVALRRRKNDRTYYAEHDRGHDPTGTGDCL